MSASGRPYRLSPLAQTNLKDIWLYMFQNWSLEQADRYQNDILAAIAELAHGLRTGRPVDIREGYFKSPAGRSQFFVASLNRALMLFASCTSG